MKKKKVVKKDSSYNLLRRKLTLLKKLMLLTHPSVSHLEMDDRALIQWNEFVKEFPSEGENDLV